jgi:septum formation protein
MAKPHVVLASKSSARAGLLAAAGVDFTVQPAGLDERTVEAPLIESGESPSTIALALAEAKAVSVSMRYPQAIVIGADQTLDFEGRCWTKPANRDAAARQLAMLTGREHRRHSAVVAATGGSVIHRQVETAVLTMRALAPAEIEAYLDIVGDDILSSVGAYQIEGRGIQLFDRIDGDYFTILGLPLLVVLAWLREQGALS